jgi:hypothetical protein
MGEDIVISDRVIPRVLALLPAIVVALCVRVLTLGSPLLAARLAAAGTVAVMCWTAYRLLTVKVTVSEDGVHVRGVFYEADVAWSQLDGVIVRPAGVAVRLLLWGVIKPQSVVLAGSTRALRPVALISAPDDDAIEKAIGAIKVRSGAWRGAPETIAAD